MFNLITEKAFVSGCWNLSYEDANPKKKTYTGHAFLIESDKALANETSAKN
jgi:hypothetical protein